MDISIIYNRSDDKRSKRYLKPYRGRMVPDYENEILSSVKDIIRGATRHFVFEHAFTNNIRFAMYDNPRR